jgi:hypothetical protein
MSDAAKGVIVCLTALAAFGGGIWYFKAGEPGTRAVSARPDSSSSDSAPAPPATPKARAATPPDSWKTINAAPEVNPRLTRAHYDQLHDGMTEEELTRLLGEVTEVKIGTSTERNEADSVKVLRWAQRKPYEAIDVELINGLSRGKGTTLTATVMGTKLPEPRFEPPGLSQANFDKVENGMTEDQVIALFGPSRGSTTKEGTFNGKPYHIRTLLWKQASPDVTITVTFNNHKVSGKNRIVLTPIKK